MIIVTVELQSAGTKARTLLGQLHICSIGGTLQRGNYKAYVAKKNKIRMFNLGHWPEAILREGEVSNYPRLSYNMWRLVIRALLSCFPEEKK